MIGKELRSGQFSQHLETLSSGRIEQRPRIVAGLHATMIALNKVVSDAGINHHRQEIVHPPDRQRRRGAAVLGTNLPQKTVPGRQLKILVISPNEKHAFGVRQFQPQQRVDHFHPVSATVGVVAQEDQVRVGPLDPESRHAAAAVQPLESRNERANIAVKIAVEDHLRTGISRQLLSERLKSNRRPQEVGTTRVEELRGIGLLSDPVRQLRNFGLLGVPKQFLHQLLHNPEVFQRQLVLFGKPPLERSVGRCFQAAGLPVAVADLLGRCGSSSHNQDKGREYCKQRSTRGDQANRRPRHLLNPLHQASTFSTTFPPTSVRRKSRPWCR